MMASTDNTPRLNAADLWDRVHKRNRYQPLPCACCRRDVVPSLSESPTRKMVKGSCPACGRYLKFLPLAPIRKQERRRKKKARPIPTETPESLALWRRVGPSQRHKPIACACGVSAVPVLASIGTHVKALCGGCGAFLGFMTQRREAHSPEQQAARFAELLATEKANGYRKGYAVAAYRARYGDWPPSQWQAAGWDGRAAA